MKALGSTLFIVGVLWFLMACSLSIGWLHVDPYKGGMIIFAGILYGPVGIVVGGFLLLKRYESRRSARENQQEPPVNRPRG